MDWNKLKKAIINSASLFGGLILLIACVAGIDYIALTHPVLAIFIALVILFCLLVVIYYLIL